MFAANIETAKLLIDAGASLDMRAYRNQTALMFAAGRGHTEFAKSLIDAGASLKIRDYKGQTAYDIAKKYGYEEIADLSVIAAG